MARPVTRLRLVLPSVKDGDARTPPTIEALAGRIADAWAVHGVQVRQQVRGAPYDGAPRADVALWLPDVDGGAMALEPRLAPARVQTALVVDPNASQKHLARFDALIVPHEGVRELLRHAQKRAGAREVPIVVAKLPGTPLLARDAEKALRGVAGRRVVLVDTRFSFDSEIERVIVQLALRSQEAAVVLLAPHDEGSRRRVRTLCERHAVDAFLASGNDGFAQSVAAADLFIGVPTWDELLLCALSRTPVSLQPSAAHGLIDVLRADKGRVLDEVMGTLQLAAALDRRLADPGALEARGIALRESVFGTDKDLLDALAAVEPLPQGALASAAWEAVGPHAAQTTPPLAASGVVEAKDADAPAQVSRGQKIEDALEALKQKIGKAGP